MFKEMTQSVLGSLFGDEDEKQASTTSPVSAPAAPLVPDEAKKKWVRIDDKSKKMSKEERKAVKEELLATTFTLNVNGIPFRFPLEEGKTMQESAQSRLRDLDANPAYFTMQAERLGLTYDDRVKLFNDSAEEQGKSIRAEHSPTEISRTDRFLVGAGKTSKDLWDGAKMFYLDDKDKAELIRQRKIEQELYEKLDNEGIGLEDVGELFPDMVAFLFGGGIANLGLRASAQVAASGLLGFTKAVDTLDSDEALKQRGGNALFNAAFTVGGMGLGKAVMWPLKGGIGAATKAFSAGKDAMGKLIATTKMGGKGGMPAGVAKLAGDALNLKHNNTNPAMQELGKVALDRIVPIISRMNDYGKMNTVKGLVNNVLAKSTTTPKGGGANFLDMNKFLKEMQHISDSSLRKHLGSDFGKSVGDFRKIIREVSSTNPGNLHGETVSKLLELLTSNPAVAKVGKQIADSSTSPEVRSKLVQYLLRQVSGTGIHTGSNLASTVRKGAIVHGANKAFEE